MPRPKQRRNVSGARRLRAEASLPERLLWNALRQQSEVKFRRQHPLGPYVLDFYCAKAKLAVEIDGFAHDTGDRPERDVVRDEWLASQGIETLRIPASEVLKSPQDVAEALMRNAQR